MKAKLRRLSALSLIAGGAAAICGAAALIAAVSLKNDYPIRPVDFTKVKLADTFWEPRLATNQRITIPYLMKMNEETGRVDNFRKAAGLKKGPHTGKRYNDSDIYKAMEAAAYALMTAPDPELKKQLDELIAVIGQAQEPDGYIFTARRIDPKSPAPGSGKERWSNLRVSHELYNVGHMYEAAVAHYQATGGKSFLSIALKNADFLVNTFGPGKLRGFPGHQEIEIGLAKLYRVTGNEKYLELAKFFLDERGHYHQGETYPDNSPFHIYNSEEYLHNHKPVLEQTEAVGHAVRATYMYSGMADVAALGGLPEYARALGPLWENVVGRKIYLTGGIGSTGEYEGFGPEYELPNDAAYAETCAAIGNALWNQRLFELHGDAKYIDVQERIIYNGILPGVSVTGDRFFYQNPLESRGKYERSIWFEVACCPANIARFLPQFPGVMYATSPGTLFINHFAAGTATFDMSDRRIEVIQETKYPWDGGIKIGVNPFRGGEFTIMLRIPGWARNEAVPGGLYRFLDKGEQPVRLKINKKFAALTLEKGYAKIKRNWRRGDIVELFLPMPIRRVVADERVRANEGRVALQRGPIVFCAEGLDNGGRALSLVLADDVRLQHWFRSDLLGGVAYITGRAQVVDLDPTGKVTAKRAQDFMSVPYFAWANRGPGEMAVWLRR